MVKLKIDELISRVFKKDKEVQPLAICIELTDRFVSRPYTVYHRETIFSYPGSVHKCLKRLDVSFTTLQEAQDWVINHCLTTNHKIEDCQIMQEYATLYGI